MLVTSPLTLHITSVTSYITRIAHGGWYDVMTRSRKS